MLVWLLLFLWKERVAQKRVVCVPPLSGGETCASPLPALAVSQASMLQSDIWLLTT